MPVGHVRNVEQRHVRLLGRAAALGRVAAPARGDGVGPHVPAASRDRHHVIAGKIAQHEPRAAIRAQLAIACEQQRVGQAGRMSVRARAPLPLMARISLVAMRERSPLRW